MAFGGFGKRKLYEVVKSLDFEGIPELHDCFYFYSDTEQLEFLQFILPDGSIAALSVSFDFKNVEISRSDVKTLFKRPLTDAEKQIFFQDKQ